MPTAGDDKKRTTDLLTKYDKTKKEWQLGKTKVRFFFTFWRSEMAKFCTVSHIKVV